MPYKDPPRAYNTLHSGIGYDRPKIVPYERELQRAADVLNSGNKVAALAGAGALHATEEVACQRGRPELTRQIDATQFATLGR